LGVPLEYDNSIIYGRDFVRTLYSTFARGWPGVALLFMRLVIAVALATHAIVRLPRGAPTEPAALLWLSIVAGVFLLLGLWTPIAGAFMAIVALWRASSQSGDPWTYVLLATLCAALVFLGPGAWSIDAYLFGWKRIEFREK